MGSKEGNENSPGDLKSSKADSDNIFVKASLIEQMEGKKCKNLIIFFYFLFF